MAEVSTYFGREAGSLAPGVHIEEAAPGAGAQIATGVPLFIGFEVGAQTSAQNGKHETKLLRLTSWEQFEQAMGPAAPGSYLPYAVRGFFENGGERCVVLPVAVSEERWGLFTLAQALRDLFGKESYREDHPGLRGVLDDIDDVDLVCVPDIMIEHIRGSEEIVFELQKQVLEYCRDMGERFAILDMPPGETTDIEKAIRHWRELEPAEGALYFPWVRVKSLHGSGEEWVPPCGHVAGIYARTDARVGFHKAPANEIVEGVLDLQSHVSEELNRQLNDIGVNCLRSFVRRGIRLWGARTLSGHRHSRYVNVRRIFLTLVRWINHNMNDLVFEPNNPLLWDRVRERLGAYCFELFGRGALKGRDPVDAYFIKCDGELNPIEVREEGKVVCEVGLAPLAPAEFILIRITQSAAGTTTVVPIGA
jgi:phage tail sheath protein FI